MRGTFLGSGGVLKVHLPTVIHHEFGVSRSEARRLVSMGEVYLDEEVCERVDIEVEAIAGHKLRIASTTVEVKP